MTFIGVIFAIISFGCFDTIKANYNKIKKETGNNKEEIKKLYSAKSTIIYAVVGIICAIACVSFCIKGGSHNNSSKWDSLTKEEKQYYKDSYGGGKSDAIDSAIDSYKKSH